MKSLLLNLICFVVSSGIFCYPCLARSYVCGVGCPLFDCVPSCDRTLSVYSLLPSVRPGVFRDTGVSDLSFESILVSLADSAFGVLVCDLFRSAPIA